MWGTVAFSFVLSLGLFFYLPIILTDLVVREELGAEIVDPVGPLRYWRFENRNGAWVGHATEVTTAEMSTDDSQVDGPRATTDRRCVARATPSSVRECAED